MPGDSKDQRRHPRLPVRLKVGYRSAGSFLVSYTMNLSKGGLFVQTDNPLREGTPLTLELTVPGQDETVVLNGRVAWTRLSRDGDPGGMGIAFSGLEQRVGTLIDRLVGMFQGLKILYVGSRSAPHNSAAKRIGAILHCAVEQTQTPNQAIDRLESSSYDLLVVDMDSTGIEGLALLRSLRDEGGKVPILALATSPTLTERCRAEGVDEVTAPNVAGADLRAKVLTALARPVTEQ